MRKMMLVSAVAATMTAAPAAAQVTVGDVGNLVNVSITDINVLNDSLNQNEIDILRNAEIIKNNNIAVPINMQVPIGIAANFCGISANVLVADVKDGDPVNCTAKNGSRALGQQVLRQTVRKGGGQ